MLPSLQPGRLVDMESLVPTEEFVEACASFGIVCEPEELERLGMFLALLLDATQRVNLTGIRDPETAWMKHIFDALTLLSVLGELPGDASIVDIGSGGGLPALPLAIVKPGWMVTCVESTGKKCDFLRSASQKLGLENVRVIQVRAEVIGQDEEYRESFDAVTARAVGKIRVLAEYTVPLAKEAGIVVLTKGAQAVQELEEAQQALYLLHADVSGTVQTPTGTLVVICKTRSTPNKYPRMVGEPSRDPLQ